MAEYNIFRRGAQTRHSQRLTFVCSIMAKDAVDAMLKFCGQKSNCTFVAMPATWKGNQSHIIANVNCSRLKQIVSEEGACNYPVV